MFMGSSEGNNIYIVFVAFSILSHTRGQYITYQKQSASRNNGCHNATDNAVQVEHFFNLVFAEFINSPPICVCVQMCLKQPTYCYPHGCLNKSLKDKHDDSPNRLFQILPHVHGVREQQNALHRPTFVVEPQKHISYLSNFDFLKSMGDNVDSQPSVKSYKEAIATAHNAIRPDPFKDRYKNAFRNRKRSQVHIRYNMREHVRNNRIDKAVIEKFEVPKSRWSSRPSHKQFFMEIPTGTDKSLGIVPSLDISLDHPKFPSKFYKRETNNKIKIVEDVEVNPNNTFSLESLIEDLIENSLGHIPNVTELDLRINVNYLNSNNTNATVTEPSNVSAKRSNNMLPPYKELAINETTDVFSINNTRENVENNKYTGDNIEDSTNDNKVLAAGLGNDDEETYRNVYNEMISKLSKHIEIQNNQSVELMEKVLGYRFVNNSLSNDTDNTTFAPVSDATYAYEGDRETTELNKTTTKENSEPKHYNLFTKGRQRLVRKIRSKKVLHV